MGTEEDGRPALRTALHRVLVRAAEFADLEVAPGDARENARVMPHAPVQRVAHELHAVQPAYA